MANNNLSPVIADFLEREKKHVSHYQQVLNEHSPYRSNNIDD
jgi:predicted N-acyltransferase